MTYTYTVTAPALPARAIPSSAARLQAGARNLRRLAHRAWRLYWERQARRSTMMLLHSLDDRTLADIGFQRSEIYSAVYGSQDRVRPYHPIWMWANARCGQD